MELIGKMFFFSCRWTNTEGLNFGSIVNYVISYDTNEGLRVLFRIMMEKRARYATLSPQSAR